MKKKVRKIVVMIPKAGSFDYDRDFLESYTHAKNWLLANSDQIPFEFAIVEYFCHTFPIDANRNECVGFALENKIDQTIWLDTDQEFPRDTLLKLIKHDLPIVAGIYHGKGEPYYPIVFKEAKESVNFDFFNPVAEFPEKDLFIADMLGMGCVAIKTEVFKELPRPYFRYRPQPLAAIKDDDYRAFKYRWSVHDVTEDVWFWKLVKEYTDYKVYVDPTIDVLHIARLKVGRWIWQAYREGYKKGLIEKHGQAMWDEMKVKACKVEGIKSAS